MINNQDIFCAKKKFVQCFFANYTDSISVNLAL